MDNQFAIRLLESFIRICDTLVALSVYHILMQLAH